MKIIVIAGPNGAGKSTFAAEYLKREGAIIYLRLPSAEYAVERVAQRVAEGGHKIPEAVVRRRFVRSWTNFRELYREVADEWQVYDNSVRPPRLMQESGEWQGVREPRVAGQSPSCDGLDAARKTADRGQKYRLIRRSQMAGQPGGFPEGEPAVKNVLAALLRAQEPAMARAAARDGVDPSLASTDDATSATAPADLTSAASSAGEVVDPRPGSNR